MKPFWKSKTMIGLAGLLAVSAPGLNDPLWDLFLAAGIPDEWVAGMKLAAYIASAVAVAYGRVVANGPLSVRS